MSAFIMQKAGIDRVAKLVADRERVSACEDIDRIGSQLMFANIEHFEKTYAHRDDVDCRECRHEAANYRYRPLGDVADVALYKSARCWLYNSETTGTRQDIGDRVEKATNALAHELAMKAEGFESAEWG